MNRTKLLRPLNKLIGGSSSGKSKQGVIQINFSHIKETSKPTLSPRFFLKRRVDKQQEHK